MQAMICLSATVGLYANATVFLSGVPATTPDASFEVSAWYGAGDDSVQRVYGVPGLLAYDRPREYGDAITGGSFVWQVHPDELTPAGNRETFSYDADDLDRVIRLINLDWLDVTLFESGQVGEVYKDRYSGQTRHWIGLRNASEYGSVDVAMSHPDYGLLNDAVMRQIDRRREQRRRCLATGGAFSLPISEITG